MQFRVEYLAGPACGRREHVLGGPGQPGEFRIVTVEERFESALDDHPVVPAEDHIYRRVGDEPDDGGVWVYTWSRPLP